MKKFALLFLVIGFAMLAGGDAFAQPAASSPAINLNLGSGEAWLASTADTKLNDLRWHEVRTVQKFSELY